jgi:predicted DNA-binding protein
MHRATTMDAPMPTRKPRMALTLNPKVEAALSDLSDALGKPAATLAAEMLEEMVPQLEGLAKFARASKSGNKAAAKRALTHMLGDSMAELMTQVQPDMFKGKGKPKP